MKSVHTTVLRSILSILLIATGVAFVIGSGGGGSSGPPLNPPVVTTPPAAQTVDDGATANFSVVATSSTALTYQWRKNGTNIGGATASSISVAAPYSDNGALYSVVVSNTDGSTPSADAVLSVTPLAPTINTQPLSLTVQSGSSATFSVAISGGTGPVTFQWRRNGGDIAGATAANYTIAAASVTDNAAAFTAAVSSPSGTLVTSAATLTVSTTPQPPAINTKPLSQTVALGQTATFSVAASSSSAITFQWSRNAVPIAGATAASYTTAPVVVGDEAAQFTVAVTNSAGTTTSSAAVLTISNLPIPVTQLAAGVSHSVALKADGNVWSWGYTGFGLMGVGSQAVTQGVPARAKNSDGTTLAGVSGVSAGYLHTAVVKVDGTVWAWGNNQLGALGDGSTASRGNPVQVKDALGIPFTNAMQVSAGTYFTLALKNDGTVWAWGWNTNRTLGDGTANTRLNPVPVLAPGGGAFTGAMAVSAGNSHAMALRTDGTVWCWGSDNNVGLLGSGVTGITAVTPVRVEVAPGVALANVVSIAAGWYHSVAITSNGTAYAWGVNTNGTLGDGTTTSRSRPAVVKDLSGNALTGIVAVAAGNRFSMYMKSDGTVWASGINDIGQLGDNTAAAFQINPNLVKTAAGSTFGGVDRIAATQNHTLIRRTDGTVWAWGGNANGQLGDPSLATRRNPVQVPVSGP